MIRVIQHRRNDNMHRADQLIRNMRCLPLPLGPVRQKPLHQEMRDVFSGDGIPIPELGVLQSVLLLLALLRIRLARPARQQRRPYRHQVRQFAERWETWEARPVGRENLCVGRLRIPRPAGAVRDDALHGELVDVGPSEEVAVEWLEQQRELSMRGTRDPNGRDDDKPRLRGRRTEGGGNGGNKVEQGPGAEVVRGDEEALCRVERRCSAFT